MSLMAELGVAEEGAGLSSANAPPSAPSGKFSRSLLPSSFYFAVRSAGVFLWLIYSKQQGYK